jgi:hypothetical protein
MRYYFDKPLPRKIHKGPVIKRLLVRCPATAKLAATGQTVEEELWAVTKLKSTKFNCPHCQQTHTWNKQDVVLAR